MSLDGDEAPIPETCDTFSDGLWSALSAGTLEATQALQIRHHAAQCNVCRARLATIDLTRGIKGRQVRVGRRARVIHTVVTSIHHVGESLRQPSRLFSLVAVLGALSVATLVWPVADKALEDEAGKPVMLSYTMVDAMVELHQQQGTSEILRPWLEGGLIERFGPGDEAFWESPEGTRLDPTRSLTATVVVLKSPPVTLSEGLARSLSGGAVGEEIRRATLVRITRAEGKIVILMTSPYRLKPSSNTPRNTP